MCENKAYKEAFVHHHDRDNWLPELCTTSMMHQLQLFSLQRWHTYIFVIIFRKGSKRFTPVLNLLDRSTELRAGAARSSALRENRMWNKPDLFSTVMLCAPTFAHRLTLGATFQLTSNVLRFLGPAPVILQIRARGFADPRRETRSPACTLSRGGYCRLKTKN